ncbi:MAG: proprotein convertase P-domain-containing protein [Blastocatellia bacterium]
MPEDTYTYRGGRKVPLTKAPDQFVVRALPDAVEDQLGIPDAERVSAASSRVTTRARDLEPVMDASRHLAPTHHAYYEAESGEEFLITDRVFVTFRQPPSAEVLDEFAGRYGLVQKASYSDRDYLFQLTEHTGMNPVKLVVKLIEDEPLVEGAEHDLNQRMGTYQLPAISDPSFARQWHLHTRLSDPDFDPRASSRCEAAWQLLDNFGSASAVIGLTDDGCKLDHPDFTQAKFAAWGYFRDERLITNADIDANPSEMHKADANHGTSCAGVIAGDANAVLTVGAAPGCRLLPIQWESDGPSLFISDSKLLTALNFVADKVDVLSNSWGGVPTNTWVPQVVSRITELARTGGRRGKGILFLWAAGNENCPIQHTTSINVPYNRGWRFNNDGTRTWVGVKTSRVFQNNLVGVPGLMHVAALASVAKRSHYSNYGTGILIAAPTNNSHEYIRLTVPGLGITTTTGAPGGVTPAFGGTSSATPLVAGIAALVVSANPNLTALEVASILKRTASKDVSMEGYPTTPPAAFNTDVSWDVSPIAPFNRGDFQNNGDADGTWSPWFGHGRVDASRAVAEALAGVVAPSQTTIRKNSAPALNIPDNNSTGVSDTINITDAASVSSAKVKVDITHSFIGDLRVTLIAPSGSAVVLHDRNGGNADNIQRTFDFSSTPALSSLAGQSVQGNWTLHIQDLANADTGRLNSWELEISTAALSTIDLQESPGVSIPDNNPAGIQRSVTTAESGTVGGIEVSVDITHTFIGDLLVKVFSPAGAEVTLHNRTGGGTDNLIRTYTTVTLPQLASLAGQQVQGAWKLTVADLEAQDVGKLNRWGVKITRQA